MADLIPVDYDPFAAKPNPKLVPVDHDPFAGKSLSWSQVPGEALSNVPSSAGHFVGNIAHAVTHPIETVGNIADLGAGAMRAGAKKVLPERVFSAIDSIGNQEANKRIEQAANGAGQFLSDRYGSAEGIKRTLATDPIGSMADASALLTGGGGMVARAPGLAGQAGRAASTVGSMVDPLALTGRAVARSGGAVADALGVSTGAGARPFREAYNAGTTGNQAFTDNMRGQRPIGDVVDMAEGAVNQMGRERSAAYKANMANVKGSQSQVDFAPVYKTLQDAHDSAHYAGVPLDAAAADVVKRMSTITHQFASIPGTPTAERFDALKRAIGEVKQRTQQGTLEYAAANQVYNSIRDQIVKQVPEYAKAMSDYSNASDAIGEMRRTMSINDRASVDTTLRKLQSTMRNNVNTNYGQRERLLDDLARYQPNLPAALAGQSLNTTAPRGLARVSPMAIIASGGAAMNPVAMAALPFTSPRLMGEAAYGVGRASGMTQRALQRAGVSPDLIEQSVRSAYLADLINRSQQNGNRSLLDGVRQ